MAPSNETQAWYLEAGAGMGTVLRMSNEKGAYTLTDRATWTSYKNELTNMAILVQGDRNRGKIAIRTIPAPGAFGVFSLLPSVWLWNGGGRLRRQPHRR